LQPARNEAAIGRGQVQEGRSHGHGHDHEQRRIGEGEIETADIFNRNDLGDLKLVDRIVCHRIPLGCRALRG
jgi:hypothetical protein